MMAFLKTAAVAVAICIAAGPASAAIDAPGAGDASASARGDSYHLVLDGDTNGWAQTAPGGLLQIAAGQSIYISSGAGSPEIPTVILVTGSDDSTSIVADPGVSIQNLRIRVEAINATLRIQDLCLRGPENADGHATIEFATGSGTLETALAGTLVFEGDCEVYGGAGSAGISGALTLASAGHGGTLAAYGADATHATPAGAGILAYGGFFTGDACTPDALVIREGAAVTARGGEGGGHGVQVRGQLRVEGTLNACGGSAESVATTTPAAGDGVFAEAVMDEEAGPPASQIAVGGSVDARGGDGSQDGPGGGNGFTYITATGNNTIPLLVEGTLTGSAGKDGSAGVWADALYTSAGARLSGTGGDGLCAGIWRGVSQGENILYGSLSGIGTGAAAGMGRGIRLWGADDAPGIVYGVAASLSGVSLPCEGVLSSGVHLAFPGQKLVLSGSIPDATAPLDAAANLCFEGGTDGELEIAQQADLTLRGGPVSAMPAANAGLYLDGGRLTVLGRLRATGAARPGGGLYLRDIYNGAGIRARGDIAFGATADVVATGARSTCTTGTLARTQGFPIIAEKGTAPAVTVDIGARIRDDAGTALFCLALAQQPPVRTRLVLGNELRLYTNAFEDAGAAAVFVPAGRYNMAPTIAGNCFENAFGGFDPSPTLTVAANHLNAHSFSVGLDLPDDEVAGIPYSLTVNGSNMPVIRLQNIGDSVQITPVLTPDDATRLLCWPVSLAPSGVISLEDGRVTALANGMVTFALYTYGCNGVQQACTVRVIVGGPVYVDTLKLNATCQTLAKGETLQLSAAVAPTNATEKTVVWTSSNPAIATVSATGLVTGRAAGQCTVTAAATDGSGKRVSCAVYVGKKVAGITLDVTSKTLRAGSSFTLKAAFSPGDAANKAVSWTSSDAKIATISSTGVVKGLKSGTATITATTQDGAKKTTCTVRVRPAVTGVKLSSKARTLTAKGKQLTLTATVAPAGAAIQTVSWKSSNTKVATVNSKGVVTAKAAKGKCIITCTTKDGQKTATCTIYIGQVVKGVKLNTNSRALNVNGRFTLKATLAPATAANKTVSWTSSNPKVATVDKNGVVKAVGHGKAVITAKTQSAGKTASCTVTVR